MTKTEPLLYPLFDFLRRHGVPLGISEYLVVIKTVREGIGVADADHLRRLCRYLWAKSLEDQALFDVAFDDLVKPRLRPPVEVKSTVPEVVVEVAQATRKGGVATVVVVIEFPPAQLELPFTMMSSPAPSPIPPDPPDASANM